MPELTDKMGDLTLICPLCCNKIFNSKEELLEHLSSILSNLFCPVCNAKVSSIEQLSEHLSLDNCVPIATVQTIVFESTENNDYESENSTTLEYKPLDDDDTNPELSPENNFSQMAMADSSDINKIQIDLMKCLQTQELKLVKEDGESRYIILSGENSGLKQEDIVTKQNKDGTVSFTSRKDIKNEESSIILEADKEEHHTIVQEYSCSTCQMSFTSVFDHINNYHTDQDVVVEGNIGNMSAALPDVEFETMETEEPVKESQGSRRVITDTGAIVETPLVGKSPEKTHVILQDSIKTLQINPMKEQLNEKTGRKRYVHVENLCEGVIRDLKPDQKSPQCHKLVLAPSVVTAEGESVKMYQCTLCKMYGSQLSEFRTQPCKSAKYSCTHCDVSYDNSKSLCAHMKVHKQKADSTIQDIPEIFECEICNTVFLTNKSLKLHKRMHDPIKSRPIDPPKNCTNGDNRYQCGVCGKLIPLYYRAIHKASHENDNMLNCGICNKKFSSTEFLDMHMNVHNMDKPQQVKSDKSLPYSCIYCDRKFARPHEKVKHERIHTGEKPHECEICGKSFRVSYCLTLHMRTHTGARPYACPHCDKRFKAHSVYNHHLLTHSEVRAYKCPFCPKAFKTSVQLAGHKNSHTKPFSCTQCNRPFASLYAVRVHTETHNRQNNLKFRCPLCGASYARAFALKDHVKQVHKQEINTQDPMVELDNWPGKDGPEDTEKDLTQEITDLEIQADELIVPN